MSESQKFLKHLIEKYPGLKAEDEVHLQSLISENLISPYQIKLPRSILKQAEKCVKDLFDLAHTEAYIKYYLAELNVRQIPDVPNHAIMMSYDFHVDDRGQLKLIEVNTNAAFLVLGYELYRMKSKMPWAQAPGPENLRAAIEHEIELRFGKKQNPRIAIVDVDPATQRLYFEFLLAREMFKSFGFDSEILDSSDPRIQTKNFIYNRDTDFFLENSRSALMKKIYLDGSACLSPHPREYFLLADKNRMIDWRSESWQQLVGPSSEQLATVIRHVPESFDFTSRSAEDIWSARKNYFFKPKQAFGSKHTFRGGTISRKTFNALNQDEFMAQEYIPAPELIFETPDGPQSFKYDLRFYAYEGNLQLVMARLYQGQVTNLKTVGGGFATVEFES